MLFRSGEVLMESEIIDLAFQVMRDLLVFTNRRLIFVDKQGIMGKKIEYMSVPYKSITRFSIESAGFWDRDADLKIWLSGMGEPIERQLKKGSKLLYDVQKALSYYVCDLKIEPVK